MKNSGSQAVRRGIGKGRERAAAARRNRSDMLVVELMSHVSSLAPEDRPACPSGGGVAGCSVSRMMAQRLGVLAASAALRGGCIEMTNAGRKAVSV